MSSKVQINCSRNNSFWNNLIKRKWQSISRISKIIENLTIDLEREKLYRHQIDEDYEKYMISSKKIHWLSIRIKFEQTFIKIYLDDIKNLSTILTKTTC